MKTSNITPIHPAGIIAGHVGGFRAGTPGINLINADATEVTSVIDVRLQGLIASDLLDGAAQLTAAGSTGWFNVKDYGALGNGTTDDTAAFNSAIAALIAAGTGVLYVPASANAYKITSSLTTISVPATVMGDGWMTGASGPISRISFTSTSTSLFTVSANGCTLRDLAMLQTGGTASAGAAINMTASTLATIDHVLISAFYDGIAAANGTLATFRRLYLELPGRYGLHLTDVGDASLTDIIASATAGAPSAGIRIDCTTGDNGGQRILDCKINGSGSGSTRFAYGIDVAVATGVTTSDLIIIGNSLENVTTDAIRVAMTGTGAFGYVVITGNQCGLFSNNSGRAVTLSGSGLVAGMIAGNVWKTDGTARAAISVTNSTNIRIGPNVLDTFNAEYTNSGGTVTDATGAIGAGVVITGTPTAGQVPIASSGTAAAWGVLSAHGCRAVRASTNLSVGNNTYTAVAFDGTDTYDTDNIHDPSTNNSRMVIPTITGVTTGLWAIKGSGYSDATSGRTDIEFRKNAAGNPASGTLLGGTTGIPQTSGIAGYALAIDAVLAAADYVECFVRTSGGTFNVVYDAQFSPVFSVAFLGKVT
jgi:hypothetical protein